MCLLRQTSRQDGYLGQSVLSNKNRKQEALAVFVAWSAHSACGGACGAVERLRRVEALRAVERLRRVEQ